MLTILQQIILGAIQGITEWLPISSSAMIALVMSNFFNITNIDSILKGALFLHLGTLLAAIIYFRKDILNLTETSLKYKYSDEKSKKTLRFIIITTLISGLIGATLLFTISNLALNFETTGKTITFFVGVFLLFTGIIQIKINKRGLKQERNIKDKDSILLGIAQGFASLPGVSRSGITVSTLLLKKFDDTVALRLSFLMSIPLVLIANIILNLNQFTFTNTALYGLATSFVFGILTIHALMKFSKKINFGWFVLIFAVLMLGSLLI